ncbi:MAG: EcsC family protein, partial [Opitutae bacterium]|nr:EcsC family protein [Opitutae bacterium]
MNLTTEDSNTLREAKEILESPGLVIKLTNLIGKPIEKGFDLLPDNWSERISMATQGALQQSLKFAVNSLGESRSFAPSDFGHKVAVMVSGAAGGAFGLAGLTVEL